VKRGKRKTKERDERKREMVIGKEEEGNEGEAHRGRSQNFCSGSLTIFFFFLSSFFFLFFSLSLFLPSFFYFSLFRFSQK